MKVPPLKLVAFEITRRCILKCRHCRGDSRNEDYPDELSTDEIRTILSNIASFSKPIIILTGGEPLNRKDVFDIASYSTSLGMRTVLATCGHFLDDDTVEKLIGAGISRISVSIDGASAESHDSFRGVEGAFDAAMKGLETARRHGLEFQINSTLTTLNIGELESLHELAVSLGAAGFHPFLLVPMGRGKGLSDFALSGEEYEDTLERIADMADRSPIEIKPTCSPHYIRVIKTRQGKTTSDADSNNQHQNYDGRKIPSHRHTMTKGCLGGQGFVFVSHVGKVQMCGFLEIEAGDLRKNDYNLADIWENSPFFKEIRDLDGYKGKCAVCEFRQLCGGCRARAYYINGDYLAEEPHCIYIPSSYKEL